MKRRKFTPEFKARIVLQFLRKEKTMCEITSEHNISKSQLQNWQNVFFENLNKAFSQVRNADEDLANKRQMKWFCDLIIGCNSENTN